VPSYDEAVVSYAENPQGAVGGYAPASSSSSIFRMLH